MSRQLSIFSYMKKTSNSSDNVNTSVNINTDILVEESGQRKGNKKSSDYVLTKEKINLWLQDETFQFRDAIDVKPSKTGKKRSWISTDILHETFICWVYEKYPKIKNTKHKVANGCSLWHCNYFIRHDDSNHQVRLKFF